MQATVEDREVSLLYYNQKLKELSRNLRKNMTDAEKFLWAKIRGKQIKGLQFYRQKILGNYIVDFYCAKANLVVELDGGQHYTQDGKHRDSVREAYLSKQGLKVLRFSDREVFLNIEGVMETIWRNI